ncbi:MAG: MBL fold metallo-hydrolase, partial [Brevinema sp.]
TEGAVDLVKRFPKVNYLLSTHWHQDHVGGNNYYAKEGNFQL